MASSSNQTSVSGPVDDKSQLKKELPEPFCWKPNSPGDAHCLGIVFVDLPSDEPKYDKHLEDYLKSCWGNRNHFVVNGPDPDDSEDKRRVRWTIGGYRCQDLDGCGMSQGLSDGPKGNEAKETWDSITRQINLKTGRGGDATRNTDFCFEVGEVSGSEI